RFPSDAMTSAGRPLAGRTAAGSFAGSILSSENGLGSSAAADPASKATHATTRHQNRPCERTAMNRPLMPGDDAHDRDEWNVPPAAAGRKRGKEGGLLRPVDT